VSTKKLFNLGDLAIFNTYPGTDPTSTILLRTFKFKNNQLDLNQSIGYFKPVYEVVNCAVEILEDKEYFPWFCFPHLQLLGSTIYENLTRLNPTKTVNP
jgi:hypothetical protein